MSERLISHLQWMLSVIDGILLCQPFNYVLIAYNNLQRRIKESQKRVKYFLLCAKIFSFVLDTESQQLFGYVLFSSQSCK